MPIVPKLRGVAPAPLSTPFQSDRGASIDAFGGGVAQGVGTVGQSLGRASDLAEATYLRERAKENTRDAKNRQVKFRAGLSRLWTGDDTTPGFSSLQGENAVRAVPEYRKQLARLKTDLLSNAPASVKDALQANFDLIEQEELDTAFRHVQKERMAAEQTVSEAALNETLDAALRDINNPVAIEREERRGLAEIRTFGASQGLPADVIQSRQEEFSTAIHTAVIDNLIETDLPRANQYFQANLGRIDGRAHAKVRRQLDRAKEQASTEAFARASDNETFIATFGRLLAENPDMKPTPAELESAVEDTGLIGALALSPEALAPYKAAATARFIERRATGNPDYTIEDALQDVTGVIEFNGRPILPPRVGMDEDEFEDIVAGLSPADFQRLGNGAPIFADGSPFTADQFDRGLFLTDAQFHSVGPGIYQIFIEGLGYIQAEGQQAAYQIDLRGFTPVLPAEEDFSEPTSDIQEYAKDIARREREALDRATAVSEGLAAEAEAGQSRLDDAREAAERSRASRRTRAC